MPPSSTRRALLATLGATALAGCAVGGDGTFPDGDWPAVGGGPTKDGFLDAPLPAGVERRWTAHLGDWPYTGPVVGDGLVVVPDGEAVRAFDAADGTREWTAETTSDAVSAPAIDADAGRVYLTNGSSESDESSGDAEDDGPSGDAEDDGPSGRLHALDAADGGREWTVAFEDGVPHGATVADGTVYVRTHAACVAVAADGTVRWRHDVAPLSPDAETGGDHTSPPHGEVAPAVADDAVFVTERDGLVAVDRTTGDRRWRRPVERAQAFPVVADGAVFAKGVAETAAFSLDGDERWRRDVGSWGPPAVAGDDVYVVADDLLELDAATGETRWRFENATGYVWSQPIVADDAVLTLREDAVAAVVRSSGLLDAGGRVRWNDDGGNSFAGFFSPAVGAGHCFVLDAARGALVAFGSA